ncbi:MAG: hypothetical protein ABEH65_12155 [Halobacteriales archaeon]
MSRFERPSLGRIARIIGTFLIGTVGTVVFTLMMLRLAQPLQRPIYDGLYLAVGPWTATVTATILTFTLGSVVAISIPTLGVLYRRGHADHLRTLGLGLLAAFGLGAVAIYVTALLGMISLLVAVLLVSLFIATVPLTLRYLGLWPDGAIVFAGGVPVLIFSMLLLGFGLGWGGGYDVVATELPAATANGSAKADLAEAPTLRDALLTPADGTAYAYCETDGDRRTCRLSLRSYDHEADAVRFLNRHGVRCPYLNDPGSADTETNASFIAEDNGTYYRISCVAYGD